MRETVTLSSDQVEAAISIAETIEKGGKPFDFIDEWKAAPPSTELNLLTEKQEEYVPVDAIVGTWKGNVDRFELSRFSNVLKLLIKDKFEKEHEYPPHLMEVDDEYYVDGDGNHRTIAFKLLDIEHMYAEVTHYEWKE